MGRGKVAWRSERSGERHHINKSSSFHLSLSLPLSCAHQKSMKTGRCAPVLLCTEAISAAMRENPPQRGHVRFAQRMALSIIDHRRRLSFLLFRRTLHGVQSCNVISVLVCAHMRSHSLAQRSKGKREQGFGTCVVVVALLSLSLSLAAPLLRT